MASSSRNEVVCVYCSEGTITVPAGTTLLNGRSDDCCYNEVFRLLQLQSNAALATCLNINVGIVRIADLCASVWGRAALATAAKVCFEPILWKNDVLQAQRAVR
jgi:hypothetical protein